MKLSERDRRGFLKAFGTELRINGIEELGIVRNEFEETQIGRVRISTNTPELDMLPEDIERIGLVEESVIWFNDIGYIAKVFTPDNDANFTTIRLIEPT